MYAYNEFEKKIKFWVFYECLKIIKILRRKFLLHTANRSARKKHSTMGRLPQETLCNVERSLEN